MYRVLRLGVEIPTFVFGEFFCFYRYHNLKTYLTDTTFLDKILQKFYEMIDRENMIVTIKIVNYLTISLLVLRLGWIGLMQIGNLKRQRASKNIN